MLPQNLLNRLGLFEVILFRRNARPALLRWSILVPQHPEGFVPRQSGLGVAGHEFTLHEFRQFEGVFALFLLHFFEYSVCAVEGYLLCVCGADQQRLSPLVLVLENLSLLLFGVFAFDFNSLQKQRGRFACQRLLFGRRL